MFFGIWQLMAYQCLSGLYGAYANPLAAQGWGLVIFAGFVLLIANCGKMKIW
jgi:hypothetical protein